MTFVLPFTQLITLAFIALLLPACLISCDLVEDDPSVTTAVTDTPTENVTDVGIDEPAEPPTESLTEPPSDMDQLAFMDVSLNEHFMSDIYINQRILIEGERLQVDITDAVFKGNALDLERFFQNGCIAVTIENDKDGQFLIPETKQKNLLTFVTPIHEGLAPGEYVICLSVNQVKRKICSIQICENSDHTPSSPKVYDDDYVNSCMNDLRAQGHNMEKLYFSHWESSLQYGYIVSLNTRVARSGETIEAHLSDVISFADFVHYESYPETDPPVILKNKETGHYLILNSEDDSNFSVIIPEDADPGVYHLTLSLGNSSVYVCPIVIFDGSHSDA